MTAKMVVLLRWTLLFIAGHNANAVFNPAPVGYWPLTAEAKGNDLSGNDNKATLHGVTFTHGPTQSPRSAIRFYGNSSSYFSVMKSTSLDLSKRDGFTLTGYLKLLSGPMAPIMEWPGTQGKIFGLLVWASTSYSKLHTCITGYGNYGHYFDMKFPQGSWSFFGVSYDKPSRKVIGYMYGVAPEIQTKYEKASVAPDTSANLVNFGTQVRSATITVHRDMFLNGEMSCVMLFDRGLTADDMKRAKTFCDNSNNGRQGANFKFHSKAKIPTGSLLTTHADTPSIIKCMDLCARDSKCASASFSKVTTACLTSNVDYFVSGVSPIADDTFDLYCLARP